MLLKLGFSICVFTKGERPFCDLLITGYLKMISRRFIEEKNYGIEITNSVNLATRDQTRFFLTSKKAIFSQKCFYALEVKIFHFLFRI